jgi:hypothetical protein
MYLPMTSRRTALAVGLAGLVSAAAPCAAAVSNETNIQRFIKMRGALDGRLVIGFTKGAYQGVVEGRVTPLFGVVSAVFSHYQPQNAGYQLVEFEQAYYTDLATGKALGQWKNPYTNKMVTVPVYSAPAAKLLITPDLRFHDMAVMPATIRVQHFTEGPEIKSGEITFAERVMVRVAPAAGKPGFDYRDRSSLTAQLADVNRSETATTGSDTTFEAICSWRPWLNMGARAGHMAASGKGRFGVTMDDLPASWREATARLRPDLLKPV